MDETTPEGRAAAGLLSQVLAGDLTTAIGRCAQCGVREAVATAHAFQGAGMVLRCPHCDHALLTIVRAENRAWIGFPGAVTLEVALAPS